MTVAASSSTTPPYSRRQALAAWQDLRVRLFALAQAWSARNEDNERADQQVIARTICAEVISALWDSRVGPDRSWLPRWSRIDRPTARRVQAVLQSAPLPLADLAVVETSYLISSFYTALLPPAMRASLGAYYTPPLLAERLLDLAASEGMDWFEARVLDPACGGGAFLCPVADRILRDHRARSLDAEQQLAHLEDRLFGLEIDDFAAWMALTFLRLLTCDLARDAGRPLNLSITVADTLSASIPHRDGFDLVVGNPPYGRVSLSDRQRKAFSRTLYGHANLYGLFLDQALRWRRPSGLVAFVTPTSFLGGQYFSRLREVLLEEAPPLVVDIVKERSGVFEDVLQETCLAVFGPNPDRSAIVHLLRSGDAALQVSRAGSFRIDHSPGAPWLLPRTPEQARLIAQVRSMTTRLADLGYRASTGPLVWNRHRRQLCDRAKVGAYPIVWAEAVKANRFTFDYRLRAKVSFLVLEKNQDHLLTGGPVVLVQRTTAKEQERRLVACAVPDRFIREHGKIVVENHVNALRAVSAERVCPVALAAVLNTAAVDSLFRCLSGSVAVSASELHSLPLPPPALFREVEAVIASCSSAMEVTPEAQRRIEQLVSSVYQSGGNFERPV